MTTIAKVPGQVHEGPGGTQTDVETVDVGHLKRRLEHTVRGEVRFDAGTRAIYANDSSNFRQVPLGVVVPQSVEDIVATHRACAEFGAPIVNRGGGTSLSGETVNRAIVIDTSKYMTWIGDVDKARKTVRCQPGAINENVNSHTGEQAGLIFGPDPSTHSRCTIGGNIGNNSCGIHSIQSQLYGPGPRMSDCIRELEVVTYDGDRLRVGVGEEERLDEIIAAGGRPRADLPRALRAGGRPERQALAGARGRPGRHRVPARRGRRPLAGLGGLGGAAGEDRALSQGAAGAL